MPPTRDPRASPRRQANVLALVLREELAAGRVAQLGDGRYLLVRERFPPDVLAGLGRLRPPDALEA
jgi:hypothetical protein